MRSGVGFFESNVLFFFFDNMTDFRLLLAKFTRFYYFCGLVKLIAFQISVI